MAVGYVGCFVAICIVGLVVVEIVLVVALSLGMAAEAAEGATPAFQQRAMMAEPLVPIGVVHRVAVHRVPAAALHRSLMVAGPAVGAMEAVDSCWYPFLIQCPDSVSSTCMLHCM
jgi:hypothetical protein